MTSVLSCINLPIYLSSFNGEVLTSNFYLSPIDPEGDLKAVKELSRVVTKGGSLLFVVPVGKPRIQFNAHRIYSYKKICY